MENVKKQLQENQTFRNCFIAFVTFFLMISAIMTNSIVSAYQVTVDKEPFQYTSYIHVKYENIADNYNYIERTYYFNTNDFTFQKDSYGNVIICGVNYNSLDKSLYRVYSITSYSNGLVTKEWKNYNIIDAYKITIFQTNNKELANNIISYRNGETINPELKNPPTPTITKTQVEGIPQAITKVMKVIIPVGLVIFGLILGIYLIKRLVAYFL